MEPTDLESRDLFRGPAAGPHAPEVNESFAFVKRDTTGKSPGYDVRDSNGVLWSVKLGSEAQTEIVVSRILWAIGFHQPPTYYLSRWTLTEGSRSRPQGGGRFRPELPSHKVVGEWSWEQNPYSKSRAMAGLLVAQLMLNNWDLKTSNNKIYESTAGNSDTRRLYVVRDLGASLGSNEQSRWTTWLPFRPPAGSRNDLDGFERCGFIDRVENGRVYFSFRGPYGSIVSHITPDDVRWTAELMARLSDRQWQDAFRAGGYSQVDAGRFIAKLKEKITQGLAL